MKMMVLYYSKTGNTKKMAEVIAQGMERVPNAQAKTCSIEAVDEAWAKESKCIVLGSPIYMANVCAAVKAWKSGRGVCYGKLSPRRRRTGYPPDPGPHDGTWYADILRRRRLWKADHPPGAGGLGRTPGGE